jgi:asparagine synthase (glutamine-hydrolysing)
VEVGVFLSAGVDSAALLSAMREVSAGKIRAITLAFEEFQGTSEDESPLAAKVAKAYSADHTVRVVGEREFTKDLPAILDAMDQPSIDGVNTWFVAKAARESGLKVAISGLGGDELFAGYPSFTELPRWTGYTRPLAAIPGLGRLARAIIRVLFPQFSGSNPKAAGFLEYASSWPGAYLLKRGLFMPYELSKFLNEELVREGLRTLQPLQHILDRAEPMPQSKTALVSVLESTFYMRNQLLRDSDWAGMAHSLEIRVPLVDTQLARSISPYFDHMSGGRGKLMLARTSSPPLPDELISRPKTGFGVPTGAWIRSKTVPSTKGQVYRQWSNTVMNSFTAPAAVYPICKAS